MTIEDMGTRAAELDVLIPKIDAEIDRLIERLDGSLTPEAVGILDATISRRLEHFGYLIAEETWLHRQLTLTPVLISRLSQ